MALGHQALLPPSAVHLAFLKRTENPVRSFVCLVYKYVRYELFYSISVPELSYEQSLKVLHDTKKFGIQPLLEAWKTCSKSWATLTSALRVFRLQVPTAKRLPQIYGSPAQRRGFQDCFLYTSLSSSAIPSGNEHVSRGNLCSRRLYAWWQGAASTLSELL